jgi:hypothetical protein
VLGRDGNGITLGWNDGNDEAVAQYLILRDGAQVGTLPVPGAGGGWAADIAARAWRVNVVYLDQFSVDVGHDYSYKICPQHTYETPNQALTVTIACASLVSPGLHAGGRGLNSPPVGPVSH